MRLDQADRIMLGGREVSRVYLGANLVWTSEFSPVSLFAQGEPGVWYDPSDFSTMFQDSAGTVPVTAVEQPVGLILDKSGNGNHAYQTTATSRPVLSARVNLLTKTDNLADAAWTKQSGTSVNVTPVPDPNGALTAWFVVGNGRNGIYQGLSGTASLGQTTRSVYMRTRSGAATVVLKDPANTQGIVTCNLTTTWQRFTLTETTTPFGGFSAGIWIDDIPATGIEIAQPDLRVANAGINLPPYQRVNTATNYDTAGFPHYLRFDGVDDRLVTAGIVWSAACDCFTAIRHTGGTQWVDVWLTTNFGSGYWAVGQSGSSSSPNQTAVGSPAYFVDGTALNPVTSGEIYTRCINQTRIVETRSLNLMANTGGLSIGGYPNFLLNGRLCGLVIAEGVTDAEASSVRRWLAGKAGVAL